MTSLGTPEITNQNTPTFTYNETAITFKNGIIRFKQMKLVDLIYEVIRKDKNLVNYLCAM